MKRSAFVLVALVSSGCYAYAPIAETTPEPGREVRLRFSPLHPVSVGEVTVNDATTVEGVAWGESDEGIALRTTWVRTNLGARYHANNSLITFARADIGQVEERRIHVAKTVVALVATIGLGSAVFSYLADPGGDRPGDIPGGDIGLRVNPSIW